jgi:hypothetical protein
MDSRLSQPDNIPARQWLSWALILVLLYLALAAVGWRRTFIETECWALYFAAQPFSVQLAAIRSDLVHPPLMYMVQRGWFVLFGQTDTAARILPIVIGAPAIVLLTLLATRITARWRLLAFFLACLYFPVGSSPSQVRMYGLALLLTTAAILLWDAWRADPRALTLAAWTAVVTLLIYTHLFGALIVAALVVLNWLAGPRKWTFTLAAAVPALAFLPWFLYVLPVYESRGLEANLTWAHENLLTSIPSLFANFLGGSRISSYRVRITVTALAAVVHLGLLVLLWWNRARFWPPRGAAGREQRWFWSAVVLAGVPIAALFAFSVAVNRAFEARFILGAAIPYSIAIFLLCELSGRAGRIVLLCVLLPWRVVGIANSVLTNWAPSDTRRGVEHVAAQIRPGDLLLVDAPDYGSVIYWEWNRRLHRSEPIAVLPADPLQPSLLGVIPPTPLERLDLSGVTRVWFLQSGSALKSRLADALAARGFFPAVTSSAPASLNSSAARKAPPPGATGIPGLLLFERKPSN